MPRSVNLPVPAHLPPPGLYIRCVRARCPGEFKLFATEPRRGQEPAVERAHTDPATVVEGAALTDDLAVGCPGEFKLFATEPRRGQESAVERAHTDPVTVVEGAALTDDLAVGGQKTAERRGRHGWRARRQTEALEDVRIGNSIPGTATTSIPPGRTQTEALEDEG